MSGRASFSDAEVKHWLASLLLDQYLSNLLTAGYDTLSKCASLDELSLEQIGVSLAGHRKRILSHLPTGTPASNVCADLINSADDGREVYDVPPPIRPKPKPAQKRESLYTNVAEYNQIPKPMLPPKSRKSSCESIDAKLGIVSPAAAVRSSSLLDEDTKPGLWSPAAPSADKSLTVIDDMDIALYANGAEMDNHSIGCGPGQPKLCVVHPEKRMPVALPRASTEFRVQRPSVPTASAAVSRSLSESDDKRPASSKPQPKPRISKIGSNQPLVMRCSSEPVGVDDGKKTTPVVVSTIIEEASFSSTDDIFSATKAKDSTSSSDVTTKKLNPGLELELEKFVEKAKLSAMRSTKEECLQESSVQTSSENAQVPETSSTTLPACAASDTLVTFSDESSHHDGDDGDDDVKPSLFQQAEKTDIVTTSCLPVEGLPTKVDANIRPQIEDCSIYCLEAPVKNSPVKSVGDAMSDSVTSSLTTSSPSVTRCDATQEADSLDLNFRVKTDRTACESEYEDMDGVVSAVNNSLINHSDNACDYESYDLVNVDTSDYLAPSPSYPPPAFDPPPLPCFIGETSDAAMLPKPPAHLSSTPVQSPSYHKNTTRDSSIDFADFAQERAQKNSRRSTYRQSGMMTPVTAGFAKALDDHFNNNIQSPSKWFTTDPVESDGAFFGADDEADIGFEIGESEDNRPIFPQRKSSASGEKSVTDHISATKSDSELSHSCKVNSPCCVKSPTDHYHVGGSVFHYALSEVEDCIVEEKSDTGGQECFTRPTETEVQKRSPEIRSSQISNSQFRGFLFKVTTGIRSDLIKRWCVLSNLELNCFENDKAVLVKETISVQDMLGIAVVSDTRYINAFELRVVRRTHSLSSVRSHVFIAETVDERSTWITVLAKNIAPNLLCDTRWTVCDMERGGIVYVRLNVSSNWQQSWMHLCDKTLYIYHDKAKEADEIDLRKSKSIRSMQQSTDRCSQVSDDGFPIAIDMHSGRIISIHADVKQETESWFSILRNAMLGTGNGIANQPLTTDNVPIIVDKCISFVALHGMEVEGIYRLSGQHSKVTQLLKSCQDDVRSVLIRHEDYQIHDVTNALKRFFRTLDEPLLTASLYDHWINCAGLKDQTAKLEAYKNCLSQLPSVNYATLKHLVSHLSRVAEKSASNKMSILNLASIFGPIMLKLDSESHPPSDYGKTNLEISIVKDFLECHLWLFEVNEKELEQQKKFEEALKRIERLNTDRTDSPVMPSSDMLMGIYVESTDGDPVTVRVPPSMTIAELMSFLVEKVPLDTSAGEWAVFEMVASRKLERLLHWSNNVIEATLSWSSWPVEACRDNCLCLKHNQLQEDIDLVYTPTDCLYSELWYAGNGKKSFRQSNIEFKDGTINVRRDTRTTNVMVSWHTADLIVYVGVQEQRNPPTKWGLTFWDKSDRLTGPFLGHSLCFASGMELYQWLGAILHVQYPEGFNNKSSSNTARVPCSYKNVQSNVQPYSAFVMPEASSQSSSSGISPEQVSLKVKSLASKFQKFVKRDK